MSALNEVREDDVRAEEFLAHVIQDVVAYCVRRVENRDDAADLAADILLVVWRRRSHLPADPVDARRWTFGVAHHALKNHRRGTGRRRALAEVVAAELAVTPPQAADSDSLDLRRALDALSVDERDLVLLVVWEGLTVADAGRALGIRPGTARVRYMRARERLRVLLAA